VTTVPQEAAGVFREEKKRMRIQKARLVLSGALAAILAMASPACRSEERAASARQGSTSGAVNAAGTPRLVDLGAGKCIPCKAMAPILGRLKLDYAGKLQVEFIDVWQDRGAAEQYRIGTIPTQIFYAADGRELSRHEGFMSREEILARWKALGVALD
jgi:thioredoxin 1